VAETKLEPSTLKPARRFLHICYCCDDVDPATDFFVDGLALRNTMRTTTERTSGAILGFDHDLEGCASFVYDHRGPRVSPALEVQSWIDPKIVGTPSRDPFEAGMKSVGFAVPDVDATVAKLSSMGCTVLGTGRPPMGPAWTALVDPLGVTFELVPDDELEPATSRLRHLRITCTDLYESTLWYEGLGFEVLAEHYINDGRFLGIDQPVLGRLARMVLPHEQFEVVLIEWTKPVSHGRHYAEPNHAGIYRAALGVDDTRASYEAMSAAGWTFDRPPMLIELTGTPVPDMWICFTSDPDGVPYEFVQRPRSAFR
jgi:catechol 2,3-dioxygenase-like lactoylglutathione lyase family enzyme